MLKGKKLLLTGLTGNLGGSLATALAPHNELWGFARYTQQGQREYWEKAGVHTVVGDCADGRFEGLPNDFDYVIHAAAGTQPRSFESGMRDNAVAPALLMGHCRKAKAFLHVSATGVYKKNPDPDHSYCEDDLTGESLMGHYDGTKLAGEGAVHGMAKYLNLPTIICRMGVQYGIYHHGGLYGILLKMLLDGHPIPLPVDQTNIIQPISDDDIVEFLEPMLNAATVPVTTINLAGDEVIPTREVMEIFGKLAGISPKFVPTDSTSVFYYPTVYVDPTRRKQITGPCKVPLREGLARMYEGMHERLRRAPPLPFAVPTSA